MTPASDQSVISAVGLPPLQIFMQARGLDWFRCLDEVGIDPKAGSDPDDVIPFRAFIRLLENAAKKTDNDAFGLEFGMALPVNFAGTIDYIVLNAPDIRTFFNDIVRYLSLVVNAYTARFEEGRTLSHLAFDFPDVHGPRAQFVDLVIGVVTTRLRHVAKELPLTVYVEIEHMRPRAAEEFFRLLGRNVRFECPDDRIGVETSLLSRPLAAADPHLYRIVREHATKTMIEREEASDIVLLVEGYIADTLKHGETSLAGAAETLGMSARALQRELEKANTTFRDLVEDTRKAMALHFLYSTSLPLTEIAFLLGFSELSAFSRAARFWFGTSPRELRKSRSGSSGN
jgi:AraC-like DNA-binding protein